MYIQGMSSCAVQEIVSLGSESTPEKMMARFCKQTIGLTERGVSVWTSPDSTNLKSEDEVVNVGTYTVGIGESYIFHGPLIETYSTSEVGAAILFATFIKEHGLGVLAEGQQVINSRYHPDHKCQVFIWNPDLPAVQAWWQAWKAKEAKPKEPSAADLLSQQMAVAAKAMSPDQR